MNEIAVARVLEALGISDTDEASACPHCACEVLIRWGRDGTGSQRWRCKDCLRTFSARTGTAVSGVQAPELFQAVALDTLSETPGSCRTLARTHGVQRMTVWDWRRKAKKALAGLDPDTATR